MIPQIAGDTLVIDLGVVILTHELPDRPAFTPANCSLMNLYASLSDGAKTKILDLHDISSILNKACVDFTRLSQDQLYHLAMLMGAFLFNRLARPVIPVADPSTIDHKNQCVCAHAADQLTWTVQFLTGPEKEVFRVDYNYGLDDVSITELTGEVSSLPSPCRP